MIFLREASSEAGFTFVALNYIGSWTTALTNWHSLRGQSSHTLTQWQRQQVNQTQQSKIRGVLQLHWTPETEVSGDFAWTKAYHAKCWNLHTLHSRLGAELPLCHEQLQRLLSWRDSGSTMTVWSVGPMRGARQESQMGRICIKFECCRGEDKIKEK